MSKKALRADIRKCFAKSKGRFFSIMSLTALGSFALVGLQITGTDMRRTGADYFDELNAADMTIIGDCGIDDENCAAIDSVPGVSEIEYGYLKDVTINGTLTSIRVFSEAEDLSAYELVDGRLPENTDEIALASFLEDDYDIGDTIELSEKESTAGSKTLKNDAYEIVGFVNSSEILSAINMGNSTAGTGELNGYAVVTVEAFDSDVYMIARLSFADMQGVDPYSDEYTELIQAHKEDVEAALADQPQARLAAMRTQYQEKIDDGQKEVDDAKSELADAEQSLADARAELDEAQSQVDEAQSTLDKRVAELKEQGVVVMALSQINEAQSEIDSAQAEIDAKEQEYQEALWEYEDKKPDADEEIADAEESLTDARKAVANLELPTYSVDTRREIPGAEGYRIYGTVADIVDSLADVFPIFLYLVAALVTLTTMTRFVDEERMNSGTLKALGYANRDVIRKFGVYGWTASTAGAIIGIAAGHVLIPLIVYNAYGASFTYPRMELHFYPGITIVALLLAFVSAVVPAYVVAVRELAEKPSQLLLPKPPANGSKILLERIKPVWNRLSFTHKVTARNIFRYKKRMLMTVFGVCGAVSLLFAGFSVQHSISGINDRQFSEILRYDLIVAHEDDADAEEDEELTELLADESISGYTPVLYEEATKVAGDNQDKQTIKLIIPQTADSFGNYISLCDRKTGEAIDMPGDGVVISERFAKLLDVSEGDTFTFCDDSETERTVRVSAVCEMYTGHFMFMGRAYYEEVFGESYEANAYLVTLSDRSTDNAKVQASRFMELSAVAGVVQNTTLINQVNTIVKSLNKIMDVLIIVAMLLGVVILYNLTNINVSERIRELSTIKVLGFYDNEVTMYIYRETILLTALGILCGYALGDMLYLYILAVVPPDEVMFNPALGAKAFIVPAVIVAIITIVLGFNVGKRLRNVDMLEALKSVD